MNGKLAVLLLVVGISCVAATNGCTRPDWWSGKDDWYGPSKSWCPGEPACIYNPLVLLETPLIDVIPKEGGSFKAGDPALFWTKLTCTTKAGSANNDAKKIVGECAYTGLFLYDAPKSSCQKGTDSSIANCDSNNGKKKDGGFVNWTAVCTITSPCGEYGVGTVTAAGQSAAFDEEGAVNNYAITGGTGAYAALASKGGVLTSALKDGIYTDTFRFIKDCKY